jgi:hypothetical protein
VGSLERESARIVVRPDQGLANFPVSIASPTAEARIRMRY